MAVPLFWSTLILTFALTLLAAGFFGAYYGKGRSRSMGFTLVLASVLILGLLACLTWALLPGLAPIFAPANVLTSMTAVAASVLGLVLAGTVFVFSVMR
jgi:hypothetical protein